LPTRWDFSSPGASRLRRACAESGPKGASRRRCGEKSTGERFVEVEETQGRCLLLSHRAPRAKSCAQRARALPGERGLGGALSSSATGGRLAVEEEEEEVEEVPIGSRASP
jgi:hypothetical protein